MFIFKKGYFFLACILFLIELLIALYIKDRFIRPYAGDFLIVIFLYCFIRSFLEVSIPQTIMFGLIFSIFIEVLQLFPVLNFFEIKSSSVLGHVLGTTFEWKDILLYVAASFTILIVEKWRLKEEKINDVSSVPN